MRHLIALAALTFSTMAFAKVELGAFLDRDTVVYANEIFAAKNRPAQQDIESASVLMRWLDQADGAPPNGDAFKGVLFNVTLIDHALKVDPIGPEEAQAALGACSVTNMNGAIDPKRRTDRHFIAFALNCSGKSALVTMTIENGRVSAAYIHNDQFVPIVVKQ